MYVLGVILAGGRGERLIPLTQHRAKPAVPFGGRYRIIDFVLSNFVNSGILSIYVLTQFKAQSLLEHLDRGWRTTDFLGEHFVTPVPAQMRSGEEWYQGTADSVYQNLYLLERHSPKLVAVFGADHIYRMNIRQMIDEHQRKSADVTVAAIPVKIEEAFQFGVIAVDADWRIIGFQEKPKQPKSIPGEPNYALVSMGNYLFNNDVLIEALNADAKVTSSNHDFGRDVLPNLIQQDRVFNVAVTVDPDISADDAIVHGTAADDRPFGDDRIDRHALAVLPIENEFRRRISEADRAKRPTAIVQIK